MNNISYGVIFLIGMLGLIAPSYSADEDEGKIIEDATAKFNEDRSIATEKLAKTNFFDSLQPFSIGARVAHVADIKAKVEMPHLGKGDPKENYQIILQPGHYGRIKGKLGTSGHQVSEQQLVAFITANVANYLIKEGVKVLVISADDYNKSGLNTDVFLSIHADGADKKCSTGPSLGYGRNSNILGMHAIGFALATSMGHTYDDFMKDNFTVNLRDYYAFKHIKSRGYGGLLEIGELTCPDIEKNLISKALLIAQNLGVALKASINILNEPLQK
jgi:hypothetical protein